MAAEKDLAAVLQALQPLQDRKKRKSDEVLAKLLLADANKKSVSAGEYVFSLTVSKPRGLSRKKIENVRSEWNMSHEPAIPPEFVAFACAGKGEERTRLSIKRGGGE